MIKKTLQIATLFAAGALLTAQASILSFDPVTQSIDAGNTAFVNVSISDLGADIVSAYDLSVSFDSAILGFSSIDINEVPFGFLPLTGSSSTSRELSFNLASFEPDFILDGLQGDSLLLATLGFNTLGAGTSALNFSFVDVTGAAFSPLSPTTETGSITVNSRAAPEPSAMILFAMSVVGFFAANKRKSA